MAPTAGHWTMPIHWTMKRLPGYESCIGRFVLRRTLFVVPLKIGGLDPRATALYADTELGLGGIARPRALIDIQNTFTGGVGSYEPELKNRKINLETLDESGIKDISDILGEKDPARQFEIAKSKLNSDFARPLSTEDRTRLEGLRNEASTGDPAKQQAFVDAMIKVSAEHGAKGTPFLAMETTLAEIKDVLIKQVGEPIASGFGLVAEFLQKHFGFSKES